MLDEILQKAFSEPVLGPLDDARAAALEAYAREIVRWNRRFNLVSRRSTETTIGRLLVESLALGNLLREKGFRQDGPALDLGSGAGFPAVPLKILNPSREIHLVEIREKRAFFLERLGAVFGWEGYFVHRRDVATLAGPFPGEIPEGPAVLRYPLITAKALGEIPGLGWTIETLLDPRGVFATYSGDGDLSRPLPAGMGLEEVFRTRVEPLRHDPFWVRCFARPAVLEGASGGADPGSG